MKHLSQRRAFVALMSCLATAFVIGISGETLAGESDLIADIVKIGTLVFLSTAIASFIFWTLTHLKKTDTAARGMFAGFLTAISIIPLPRFSWVFKTEFLSRFQGGSDGFISAIFAALPTAIGPGLYTFIDITKASLIAVIGSIILGAAITHYIPTSESSPKI